VWLPQSVNAQDVGSVTTISAFDGLGNQLNSLRQPSGRTIVVQADDLDLGKKELSTPLTNDNERLNLVILARRLTIGPGTNIELPGTSGPFALDRLQGGSLWIVAQELVLNGIAPDASRLMVNDLFLDRAGGRHPSQPTQPAPDGRVFVYVDRVSLAPSYAQGMRDLTSELGTTADEKLDAHTFSLLASGFSASNPIHQAGAGSSLTWRALPGAYEGWLAYDLSNSPAAFLTRELRLRTSEQHPLGGSFDEVHPFADAGQALPSDVLNAWYNSVLQLLQNKAQNAVNANAYSTAYEAVTAAEKLMLSAPNNVLSNPAFSLHQAAITAVKDQLKSKSRVETVSIPVSGAGPVQVTVIRDLAFGRIEVLPNMISVSAMQTSDFRFGFVQDSGSDSINIRLRGQLGVDPSVLAAVRAQFASTHTEVVPAGSDIQYGLVDLGLPGVAGSPTVDSAGRIDFDLTLPSSSAVASITPLLQDLGADVVVKWTDVSARGLTRTPQDLHVNFALQRTDTGLPIADGAITNPFSHPVRVLYALSGDSIINTGFPIDIAAGGSQPIPCEDRTCFVPGAAVRHQVTSANVLSYFEPIQAGSALTDVTIENVLTDNPNFGGRFKALELNLTYTSGPGATPQKRGPIFLSAKGEPGSLAMFRFIGPSNGAGQLQLQGRATYGENGSREDLKATTLNAPAVVIDEGWLQGH
jgi:hypothetical protein